MSMMLVKKKMITAWDTSILRHDIGMDTDDTATAPVACG
jgi:hypothetical protein